MKIDPTNPKSIMLMEEESIVRVSPLHFIKRCKDHYHVGLSMGPIPLSISAPIATALGVATVFLGGELENFSEN